VGIGTGAAGGSTGDAAAAGTGGGSTGGAAATGTGGSAPCAGGAAGWTGRPIFSSQCGDGVDNDGDGKIDYDDLECISPLDNDESSFGFGIPGDNIDACKLDCFFDGNSGMGDDGCVWQRKCDPMSMKTSCPFDEAYALSHPTDCSLTASQSQRCLDSCGKLVPNGCDCFGCCAVPGVSTPVHLAYTCTAADFNDPGKCPPCTQVTQCSNPCARCEICIGKPTVPDDCRGSDECAAPYDCPNGAPACGAYGTAPWLCPPGTGCVTGCCLPLGIF
jgi:hypothetical protein